MKRHAFTPAEDTKVFVCGLPAVYEKLCGPRVETDLGDDSILKRLGYSNEMVVKF